jgi:HSP20 family protein
LFENLLDLRSPGKDSGAWIPNADISETDDFLVVKVELSGVAPEDLQVSVHGDQVILEGEKRQTESDVPSRYQVAERAYGRFRRAIHLGAPVNTHRAEAVLSGGLLRIRFPKVPNRRGEQVPIEVTSR